MPIASLQLTMAAEKAVQEALFRILALKGIVINFRAAEYNKGASVKVPVFESGEALPFAEKPVAGTSSNYAGENSGVDGVDLLLDQHLVKVLSYMDRDFDECDVAFWLEAGRAIGRTIGRGIVKNTLTTLADASITNSTVLTAAQAATKTAIANLYAIAANAEIDPSEAALILTPTHFAALLSTLDASTYGGPEAIQRGIIPGAFGFETVASTTLFPAIPNLGGAILHKEALAIAGRPITPQGAKSYEEVGLKTDESSGLTLGFRRHTNTDTGRNFLAGEVLFGKKLIQPEKIVKILTAAAG